MRVHPKGVLLAVGVVLPLALALGLVLQAGSNEPPGIVPAVEASRGSSSSTLEIRFVRVSQDRIEVQEARTGRTLRTVTAANGGFLWGILRPLERERDRYGAEYDAPYVLSLAEGGRLTLEDPESNLQVDLTAFGATSAGLFRSLITGGPEPSIPSLFPSSPSMEDRP